MNSFSILNNYVIDIISLKQFKRMPKAISFILLLFLFPAFLVGFIHIGLMYIMVAFWHLSFIPLDYLHNFLAEEGKNVKHATQAVVYYICLPFIFFLEVIKSTIYLAFGISFFVSTIHFMIFTLSGIAFKPFISNQEDRLFYLEGSIKLIDAFVILMTVVSSIVILIFYVVLKDPYANLSATIVREISFDFYKFIVLILFIQLLVNILIFIIYPIMNFKMEYHLFDILFRIFTYLGISIALVMTGLSIAFTMIDNNKTYTNSDNITYMIDNEVEIVFNATSSEGYMVEGGSTVRFHLRPFMSGEKTIRIFATNGISCCIDNGVSHYFNGTSYQETMVIYSDETDIIITSSLTQYVTITIG